MEEAKRGEGGERRGDGAVRKGEEQRNWRSELQGDGDPLVTEVRYRVKTRPKRTRPQGRPRSEVTEKFLFKFSSPSIM